MHIVSNKSHQRANYDYVDLGCGTFIGWRRGAEPYINWKHVDGPLLYTSDCRLEWLSLWDRFLFMIGVADLYSLDRKYRRRS